MSSFTIRRSKRKCNSKYGSPTAPCEPPTKRSKRDTGLKGRSSLLGNEKDIDLLFRICLMQIIPHVWVKIIPTDTDDILKILHLQLDKSGKLFFPCHIKIRRLICRKSTRSTKGGVKSSGESSRSALI